MLSEYLAFKPDADKVSANFFADSSWPIPRFCNSTDPLPNNLALPGPSRPAVHMVLPIKIFSIGTNFSITSSWPIPFKRHKTSVWSAINGLTSCSIFSNCIAFVNKIIKSNCSPVGTSFWLTIGTLTVISSPL